MTRIQTQRWWFAAFVAVLGGAVGVLTGRANPLLIGLVGLVYLIYTHLGTSSEPAIDIERALSDPEPTPGQEVRVTVTVGNTGGYVTDLRVIDGVPHALEVSDGSPRHATALSPGAETTYSYTLSAERGQHGFEPLTVITRTPSGSVERERNITVDTILTCHPPLSAVPLQSQTTHYTGRITTDTGGSGVEFHTTREYQPGDALSRIDWNKRAGTGDLTTIEFREERAAAVMLVIDARAAAYWTRSSDDRHAVAHSVAAAGRVFAHLLAGGDRVGLTAWAPENIWLAPDAGTNHVFRARDLLATHPAFSYRPPVDDVPELTIHPEHEPIDTTQLLERLGPETQLILFSPLCDDASATAAQQLAAHDRAVTVITPDVTRDETVGHQLARVQRANRINQLRERHVRVVDWDISTPLEAVLARAEVRR